MSVPKLIAYPTDETNSALESRTGNDSRPDLRLRNAPALNHIASTPDSKLFVLKSHLSSLENELFALPRNLSVLSTDLPVQHRAQTHLRDTFNDLELKYRTLNETKAQICRLLTGRQDETNSALESRTGDDSRPDLRLRNVPSLNHNASTPDSKLFLLKSHRSSLENELFALPRNLSVLSTDLFVQHRAQTHLRDRFNGLELKYRTLHGTKAQICRLLTGRQAPGLQMSARRFPAV
ncbi:uncharacterized protein LOC132389225 [Hypanus sabinus]|uniref:uncharacterized protein LOC132389225 n=1 Tax=Hypanus sabinus TaxID=79690 RepID=UPI0028C46A02|nr:uncharacterized protein LOC132389225 [Hypanus sabinus]